MNYNTIHIEKRIEAIEKTLGFSEDPIRAFHEGKYPELLNAMQLCVYYKYGVEKEGFKENFLNKYPHSLSEYLWEILNRARSEIPKSHA
jgi:hypothetical protein